MPSGILDITLKKCLYPPVLDYQFSLRNSVTSKRYPSHKCYSPDHWDPICNLKCVNKSVTENNRTNFGEPSTECDILFSNYTQEDWQRVGSANPVFNRRQWGRKAPLEG